MLGRTFEGDKPPMNSLRERTRRLARIAACAIIGHNWLVKTVPTWDKPVTFFCTRCQLTETGNDRRKTAAAHS